MADLSGRGDLCSDSVDDHAPAGAVGPIGAIDLKSGSGRAGQDLGLGPARTAKHHRLRRAVKDIVHRADEGGAVSRRNDEPAEILRSEQLDAFLSRELDEPAVGVWLRCHTTTVCRWRESVSSTDPNLIADIPQRFCASAPVPDERARRSVVAEASQGVKVRQPADKEPVMFGLVVYESIYGNTRAIAEAIAEGMGGAQVVPAHAAPSDVGGVDLLILGGPTHVHGMTTTRTRQAAVEAVHEDGEGHIEPGAAAEPGLRAWLRDLPQADHAAAAAFDTRADKSPWLTGAASRGIAKRLRRRGYDVVGTESFLVDDSEGPMAEGELDRARSWGRSLAESLLVRGAASAS